MSFSSVAFIMFIFAVFVVYFQIPHKFRYILLVFANFLFYGSFGSLYLIILLYITVATYAAGIQFEKRHIPKSGLIACFAAVLLPLFTYKYLNFTLHTIDKILSIFSLPVSLSGVKLLYPLGISFYTFESLGYVIDVYKGRIKAERNFFKLLIFISFFPNIISGPIERAGDFLPQLNVETAFDYDRSVTGFRRMLLGLFKKVVCADYLALLSDSVFDRVVLFKGPVFIVAVIVYTYQIYLDFSGYTDIAIGAAQALGFNLRENFKAPYLSRSIKEFFGRWHMSLSTWLRDYIYIPLGGNRGGKNKKYRNLMITFLVSGLWHGANYTFIVWGLLHGIYQCLSDALSGALKKAPDGHTDKSLTAGAQKSASGIIITFCLVSFAWLFFRVNSLGEALYIIKNVFVFDNFHGQLMQMGFVNPSVYIAVIGIIAFTVVLDILSEKTDILAAFAKFKLPVRWLVYITMLTCIITMRAHIGADASFIYFSF